MARWCVDASETPPVVSEIVFTSTSGPGEERAGAHPVIRLIYAGGYINGSARALVLGDRLAHKGVIVVTIAYRLGRLASLRIQS